MWGGGVVDDHLSVFAYASSLLKLGNFSVKASIFNLSILIKA